MRKLLNLQKWAEVLGVEAPFALRAFMPSLMNAVTLGAVTPLSGGSLVKTCTVIATADADTASGNIVHGFLTPAGVAVAPDLVILTPNLVAGVLKGWAATTIDATNVVLTGQNVVGSGNAGVQLTVTMIRFHSLVR